MGSCLNMSATIFPAQIKNDVCIMSPNVHREVVFPHINMHKVVRTVLFVLTMSYVYFTNNLLACQADFSALSLLISSCAALDWLYPSCAKFDIAQRGTVLIIINNNYI